MTSHLEARKKLEEALQEYVETVSGSDGIVRTDYMITIAAANLHLPVNASEYFYVNSGPMHSLAGLKWMQEEQLKGLNREEMEADASE